MEYNLLALVLVFVCFLVYLFFFDIAAVVVVVVFLCICTAHISAGYLLDDQIASIPSFRPRFTRKVRDLTLKSVEILLLSPAIERVARMRHCLVLPLLPLLLLPLIADAASERSKKSFIFISRLL